MRTFHTGGIAGADITHGLPRVVEIFEARNPKGAAQLAEIAGTVAIEETERQIKITIVADERERGRRASRTPFRAARGCSSRTARWSRPGDALHEGSISPAELLRLKGYTAIELYLVGEVQKVYKSQGVEIHDKHIELIVRQMLKKVRVDNAGDTDLLPGQLVDKLVLDRENTRVKKLKSKEQATSEPLILGITKASLATESFLSAASFQETTKVLTDAAIEGKVDRLLGLKENVIIGKLIPAATGLKRYRHDRDPPVRQGAGRARTRARQTEEQLLAALEEIGSDGGDGLAGLGLDFGGEPEPTAATATARRDRGRGGARGRHAARRGIARGPDGRCRGAADRPPSLLDRIGVVKKLARTHRRRRGRARAAAPRRAARSRPRRTRASAASRSTQPIWIDFGWPTDAFNAILGKPGIVVGASSGAYPAQMRAAGAATVYFDLNLNEPDRHDDEAGRPGDDRRPRRRSCSTSRVQQTGCATPVIVLNELVGRGPRHAVVGQQRAVPRRTC